MIETILNTLIVLSILFGLFFMALAAVGLLRMPDFYLRTHAATKGVTLGLMGLVVGVVIAATQSSDANTTGIITKAALLITFQFVTNPVAAHLLSKAAHLDGCPQWKGHLGDELAEDRAKEQST